MLKLHKGKGIISWIRQHRKLTLILAVSILVLVLGIASPFAIDKYREYKSINAPSSPLSGGKSAHQAGVDQLLKAEPAASSDIATKLEYYDNLTYKYGLAEQYDLAISTFNKRLELSNTGLDYDDYYLLTGYYEAVGSKADALKALAQVEKFIPPRNDPEEGYLYDNSVARVAKWRQELSQ